MIGAVNGPAITGGFELALNCDFLVASERARFGDTHTRVGVMPGWGLTVLLPQAIGVRRAREMSFTGNFLDAARGARSGASSTTSSPHDELLPFTRGLATDIIGNDQRGVRQIRKTYDAVASGTVGDGWEVERRDATRLAARRGVRSGRGRAPPAWRSSSEAAPRPDRAPSRGGGAAEQLGVGQVVERDALPAARRGAAARPTKRRAVEKRGAGIAVRAALREHTARRRAGRRT